MFEGKTHKNVCIKNQYPYFIIRTLGSRRADTIAQVAEGKTDYFNDTLGKTRNRFSLQLFHRTVTAAPFLKTVMKRKKIICDSCLIPFSF